MTTTQHMLRLQRTLRLLCRLHHLRDSSNAVLSLIRKSHPGKVHQKSRLTVCDRSDESNRVTKKQTSYSAELHRGQRSIRRRRHTRDTRSHNRLMMNLTDVQHGTVSTADYQHILKMEKAGFRHLASLACYQQRTKSSSNLEENNL